MTEPPKAPDFRSRVAAEKRERMRARLLAAMARALSEQGARSLVIWVLSGNIAARGFYAHLGGRPVAERAVQLVHAGQVVRLLEAGGVQPSRGRPWP